MINKDDVAVQSYCFRHFKTNEEVAAKVAECGLSKLELCGVHADFSREEDFDRVISIYKESGIGIVCIGVQGFSNNPEREEKYFRFAKKAGARVMSVDFDPASFPACVKTAEKLADQYDVNLAIHNHGGRHWLGSAQAIAMVFGISRPRIGLMLDTAWALDAGEDPVKMAERFAGRLYGVHVKDFVFDRARKHKDVVVGTGNLDMAALFGVLVKNKFSGAAILEYEGDVENPVPALKKCVKAVQKEVSVHG